MTCSVRSCFPLAVVDGYVLVVKPHIPYVSRHLYTGAIVREYHTRNEALHKGRPLNNEE